MKAGATAEEIAIAQANLIRAESDVRDAQAAYDGVRGMSIIGMLPESRALHLATQEYAVARARYDQVVKGATPEEIRRGRGRGGGGPGRARPRQGAGPRGGAGRRPRPGWTRRRPALQQARAGLAAASLTAPFAGTVAAVNVNPGETVAPGVGVITLGDLSALRLETDDLSETSVGRVKLGQTVGGDLRGADRQDLQGQGDAHRAHRHAEAGRHQLHRDHGGGGAGPVPCAGG